MKKITCIIVLMAFCYASKAQFKLPKALVSAHLEYANPVSADFNNAYKFGIGGDVEAGIGLGKTMLTGLLDYKTYSPHSNVSRLNVTCVKLGIRQYLLAGFFLNVNGGNATLKADNLSENRFVIEGGAGFKLIGLEVLANYGSISIPKAGGGSYSAGSFIVKAGFALKL